MKIFTIISILITTFSCYSQGYYSGAEYVPQHTPSRITPDVQYRMATDAREAKMREARSCINQVNNFYHSVSEYPTSITNGWHEIHVTDNEMLCGEMEVFVTDNKVTKFPNEDVRILSSQPIVRGKASVRCDVKGKIRFFDIYFLAEL